MKCPSCLAGNAWIIDKRDIEDAERIRRIRSCRQCAHRWITHERVTLASLEEAWAEWEPA